MADNLEVLETMYVSKQLAGAEDLTRGFNQELQDRSGDPKTPVTQLNASHFQGVLTFNTIKELKAVSVDYMGRYKCAVVKETGQIYFFNGSEWITPSNVNYEVKNIEDLANVPEDIKICVVTDLLRGGIFVYDDNKKSINNKGTIINGWVRQYDSEANVQWFGAVGNGVKDDTEALQQAVNSEPCLWFPKGIYYITNTIQLKNSTHLRGTQSSYIKMSEDKTMIKMGNLSIIETLMFEGQPDRMNQCAVWIDGGSSQSEVNNCKVLGCHFNLVGGVAWKITNVTHAGNICSNNTFRSCVVGVNIGLNGNGSVINSNVFDNCGTGVRATEASAEIVGNTFTDCNYNVELVAGNASNTSKTIFSGCTMINSKIYSVYGNNPTSENFKFDNCVISGRVFLENCNKFRFFNCDLTSSEVIFSSSNDNYFINCITDNIVVTNDYNGVFTRNFFVNSVANNFDPLQDQALDGGKLELLRLNTDFDIPANKASAILFDDYSQSLPYHDNFRKDKFTTLSNGLIDLTKVVTITNKQYVRAEVQLWLNATDLTTRENLDVYLYRVLTDEEDVNLNIDPSRIEAICSKTALTFTSSCMYSFSGNIPRGKYKLVVKAVGSMSNKKFLQQGSNNTPFRLRVWGI